MLSPAKPHALLSNSGDAPAYWHVDILWAILITGSQTAGQFSLIEEWCPRDSGPPSHIHELQDEAFYVVEGLIHFELDGTVVDAGSGALVSIPRGTPHSFRIVSETARVLNLYSPAGFEEMVMALGSPAPSRTIPPRGISEPDPVLAREWAGRVGMRPVGDLGDRKKWI